ncbi:MAG: hypothetical protein R3B13_02590 [Polyangiaceae bacterium]
MSSSTRAFHVGVDENGLGARLGPLVVTAVMAEVDERGVRALSRPLPRRIAEDLDDSKRLVAHGNVGLGEAWARALSPTNAATPQDVLSHVLLEPQTELERPCPRGLAGQCWSTRDEAFAAAPELVARLSKHLRSLETRGVRVCAVRSSTTCTRLLNDAKAAGRTRFTVDLHAMERLILTLRDEAKTPLLATCGKVGGIADYSRYFGPLSGRLHAVLSEARAHSAYHFPGLGELHFLQDADAKHPLVMLASLVGKWVRELLMARIVRFYADAEGISHASGYNDPVTNTFVEKSALLRKRRRVPGTCFERVGANG